MTEITDYDRAMAWCKAALYDWQDWPFQFDYQWRSFCDDTMDDLRDEFPTADKGTLALALDDSLRVQGIPYHRQ